MRFASWLPDCRFRRLPDQTPQDAPQSFSPGRDRTLAMTFRSPATNPALADSIPGSKFLAYRFASRLTRTDDPFGSSLRCRCCRFATGDRRPQR